MKKLLSMVIVLLITASCAFGVSAAGKGSSTKDNGHATGTTTEKSGAAATKKSDTTTVNKSSGNELEALRVELKENKQNKEIRKELIKKIVDIRKQNHDNSIPLVVNGVELKSDVPPVIKYNRILIPVRAVSNALGADVQLDGATQIVTITKAGSGDQSVTDSVYGQSDIVIKIDLKVGSVTVNDKPVSLDVNPQVINNRTMVPIRFIAETFNMIVECDTGSGAVFIDDKGDTTPTAPATGSGTTPTTQTGTSPASQTPEPATTPVTQ